MKSLIEVEVEAPAKPTVVAMTEYNSRPHRLVWVPGNRPSSGHFVIERQDPDSMGAQAWTVLDDDEDGSPIESGAVAALFYTLAFGVEITPIHERTSYVLPTVFSGEGATLADHVDALIVRHVARHHGVFVEPLRAEVRELIENEP